MEAPRYEPPRSRASEKRRRVTVFLRHRRPWLGAGGRRRLRVRRAAQCTIAACAAPSPRRRSTRPPSPAVTGTAAPSRISPDEQLLGQLVLQLLLDHPLQRPRAVDRVVAAVGEPGPRRLVHLERDVARRQPLAPGGRAGCRRCRPCSPGVSRSKSTISSSRFRNSGRKCARTAAITWSRAASAFAPSGRRRERLAAEVRGQDDQRVLEVDHPCPARRSAARRRAPAGAR